MRMQLCRIANLNPESEDEMRMHSKNEPLLTANLRL
jgi:hypothetical protein